MTPEYGGIEDMADTDVGATGLLDVLRGLLDVKSGLVDVMRWLVEVRWGLLELIVDLFMHFSMWPFNTSLLLNFLPHN